MISRASIVVGTLSLAACGTDVQLGVGPDASGLDDPPRMVTAGTYALAFRDPGDAVCSGALTGNEASFSSIARASIGFVDGTVMLALPQPDRLVITGAPITSAFGQALALAFDPQRAVWETTVFDGFGSGPLSTNQNQRLFAVNNASPASGLETIVAATYLTAATDGACAVSFNAVLADP